jgi:hypothetical protein
MASPMVGPLSAFLSRLRHPTLFKIAAAVFVLDLVTPDLIPLITFGMPVDEILMALVTLGLASWKSGSSAKTDTANPPPAPSADKAIIEGESKRVN